MTMMTCNRTILAIVWFTWNLGFLCNALRTVSIVTGGSGFVGREIIHTLLNEANQIPTTSIPPRQQEPPTIFSLVRPSRVSSEQNYWSCQPDAHDCPVIVMPYDMLDGGLSLRNALNEATTPSQDSLSDNNNNNDVLDECCCCVYHTASFFGPSENHVQTALDNVQGTEDVVQTLAQHQQQTHASCKLILTSSMAAVRGTNQAPRNGKTYTSDDWNTISKLGESWGSSYQWSKGESERRAWQLSKSLQVPMVALCPSFIFGPPRETSTSSSYSITLVNDWIKGTSPVQSRLCVDIRDVAKAHVAAGQREHAVGGRFIISTDARLPSQLLAQALQQVVRSEFPECDPNAITYDSEFTGGSIPIGQVEVEATARLEQELGVLLRPVTETIAAMGRALLAMKQSITK